MNRRSLVVLLFSVAASACYQDRITAFSNGEVKAVLEENGVRLTNMTNEARAFTVNDPTWLAAASLALIAQCSTVDTACLRLPANSSVFVPFAEVGGYNASSEQLTVWTWRVLPNGAGGSLQPVMDDAITLQL
jgi:hypothetical protein